MKIWPKCFEAIPEWRVAFESACEAQEIYGIQREDWHPVKLDKATADFIWNEAKRLLNY